MNTQTNPFFVDVKDGVQKAADEHGIELYITDAQDDPTIQMKDVENLITKNRTRSSLIPVILMQLFLRLRHAMRLAFRYLPWTVKQTAATLFPHIGYDAIKSGKLAGQFLVDSLGGKRKDR